MGIDPTPVADQLFTRVNIVSVGIAGTAVNVVANTLYKLVKAPPKWTAFISALVIACIIVSLSSNQKWYDWALAFLNACLLYCSALGINVVGGKLTPGGQGSVRPDKFFKPWY